MAYMPWNEVAVQVLHFLLLLGGSPRSSISASGPKSSHVRHCDSWAFRSAWHTAQLLTFEKFWGAICVVVENLLAIRQGGQLPQRGKTTEIRCLHVAGCLFATQVETVREETATVSAMSKGCLPLLVHSVLAWTLVL